MENWTTDGSETWNEIWDTETELEKKKRQQRDTTEEGNWDSNTIKLYPLFSKTAVKGSTAVNRILSLHKTWHEAS